MPLMLVQQTELENNESVGHATRLSPTIETG